MPIVSNFNKLIYLKRFNNYFNRKIYGSSNLADYFNGISGASITKTQTFTTADFTDYNAGGITLIKTVLNDLPIGITIQSVLVSFENLGAVDFSFVQLDQIPDSKKAVLVFDDNSSAITDFDPDFKIIVEYVFINREYKIATDVNFNANDDVVSEIVGNDIPFDPDYLLVVDPTNDAIITRWFIVKHERTREKQFRYALKRDVIYDYLDQLQDCPIYVHKGMLDQDDPFAVNSEGMMVNQIKTSEKFLVDESNISWIILYVSRKFDNDVSVSTSAGTTIVSTTKRHLIDNEYDMIAIPFYHSQGSFKNAKIIDTDGTNFTTQSNICEGIINQLIVDLDALCYDVQMLPYNPNPTLNNGGFVDLQSAALTEHIDFEYIKNASNQKIGVMIYQQHSSFTTDLYIDSYALTHKSITTDLNKKESSNLQLFRLVSPNYQGTFDINIGKNGNVLTNFKAYCTYKPYTPFIKVAPEFTNFYGSEFKDARGLLCGGDFSITRVSDAWINYQLNNKNYQNIFNREIQNLEFNQSIEMRNQIISAVVGHFAATGAGAAAGAMVGGWVGAIVGGAVAGTASLVSGIVDTITLARQQREQKSLAVDKFNYELGNIQALPYTLTKVGALDYTSKIFPFVEQYDCTTQELEAFRKKIQYESMTVLRIDTLNNYYQIYDRLCYFKGEVIINDKIAQETYVLEAIYAELLKGVYI